MTGMSVRCLRPRWRTCAAGLALQVLFAGCHHGLDPGPVELPPAPLLVCPPPLSATHSSDCPAPAPADSRDPVALPEPELIDLPTALRLANSQNPQIAVARERIREAFAMLER